VELCIAFTILDSPNGNPMSQEKRQVFIEWEDIVNNGGGGNGGGGTCDGVINFVDLTTVSLYIRVCRYCSPQRFCFFFV